MRASLFASTALAAMVAGIATADAGGFAVREQSAYGQGSSFAGMAAPGDSISSMFWNPAAVTIVDGIVVEGNVTGIFPRSKLDVEPTRSTLAPLGFGNGGNVGEIGVVPTAYFAMPVNDRLYFGLSINAPYGLATTSDAPWVGMISHLEAEAVSFNATPIVGVKINDMLSIAVGLQVQYFDVDIKSALAPIAGPPKQRVSGDDWGIGFVAGLTFTPMDGTTIGIGYRSMIKQSLEGTQSFDIPVGGGLVPAGSYPIGADIDLPETISVGLRQRITESFTMMAGMEWTNWSRIQTVPFEGSPVGADLALNYEDGWFFSLGGEYKYNPELTLRAGVGYEIAPTEDEHRSIRLPDADRIWASVGASYDWNEKLSLDLGYSHLFVDDGPIDETTAGIRYAGTAEGSVDIISVGFRYKFGG
ncbi:OmpP1/FadL family transporter [Mesorhizobium xinjiangense]|uniref:OmpP1/FadL family transporter n=1 Tax=Mesorhizobium xinjiangense TaxID=2678685 RepID=UPI0012ECDA1B|nr:outer membrane protein transport protein [Mesorhizobium xinjiangense]